jgi:hypothetical protein
LPFGCRYDASRIVAQQGVLARFMNNCAVDLRFLPAAAIFECNGA